MRKGPFLCTISVTLENYKILLPLQTTNTDQFIVSPPYGIVEPGTTKLVKIYFKAHSAYTDDLKFCRDCFLVQSIVVEPELTDRDITSELFRDRQKQEAKLKVLVVCLFPLRPGKIEAMSEATGQRQIPPQGSL